LSAPGSTELTIDRYWIATSRAKYATIPTRLQMTSLAQKGIRRCATGVEDARAVTDQLSDGA
jgi:hypothetical protein